MAQGYKGGACDGGVSELKDDEALDDRPRERSMQPLRIREGVQRWERAGSGGSFEHVGSSRLDRADPLALELLVEEALERCALLEDGRPCGTSGWV